MNNEEAKRRRLASALDYQARGLILAPMHTVKDGICQGAHEIAPGVWRRGGECTCKPGKHPAGKWTSYRDVGMPNRPQDLHKWVGRDQNLGALMDCGALRIWVADCDTPEALDYVLSIIGPTPSVVETGRDGGGWHLYYLLPPGVSMKADNGRSCPGLDIKTSGFVIAPWGRHHSGRFYTPCDGFDLSRAPIADPHLLKPVLVPSVTTGAAPTAVTAKVQKPKQPRAPREAPRWYYYGQRTGMMYDSAYLYKMARKWLFRQGGCIQGRRGRRRLFRYTCELVRWYLLDAEQTLRLLTDFNILNDPPFSSQELTDAVDAAFVLGTWSERGRLSYLEAHAREKAKSVKSSERRSARRAETRGDLKADLREFLMVCCAQGEEHKTTATDLWTAFCDFAPWLDSGQRDLFGRTLNGAVMEVFPVAERKRERAGYVFSGVRLLHNYLEHCAHAA